LAYHDGFIYALTAGIELGCGPVVFKIAVGGTTWSAPVTIGGGSTGSDGFTVLVNHGVVTFLINDGDGSCGYHEYNSNTGSPTGKGVVVSGFGVCSGVDTSDNDTDGTHVLYFAVGPFRFLINQIHSATLTPSFMLTGPSTTFTPGDSWGAVSGEPVEDISLVHGFAGTPGAADCHDVTTSELAQRYRGMPNAASALGYASVKDLQEGIRAFCGD
jgi:hypothetical protein